MTTDKNNTAPDPQPAERANASVVEQIAQQWDGCQYDAPSEMVDIGAAIRRAGKRLSAELAEQQRELIVLALSDAYSAGAEGLQFGGLARLEALASALAATGKQQVGEVQGDARAQFEAVAKRLNISLLTWGGEWKYISTINAYQMFEEGWKAALATRQPGAQEPVAWMARPVLQSARSQSSVFCSDSNLASQWDYSGHPEYGRMVVSPLYAAPPAQGIDLGQQRPLIARSLAEWHEDDGNVMWWAWCGRDWAGEPAWCGTPNDSDWPGYHTHWTQHPAKPALIGQRDAAPGVGNG